MTLLPDQTNPDVVRRRREVADRPSDVAVFPAFRSHRRHRDGTAPYPFATVSVFGGVEQAAADWLALETMALASPYQTLAWIDAWITAEAVVSGTRPLIGVARDHRGKPVALLPLGLVRKGPVTIAAFLGGRHSNYNLGLFDPAIAWSVQDVERLLRAVAEASPARPDLVALTNQPLAWRGWSNPLALLPRQASPSQAHRADLLPDGEAFLKAHLSAATRKKMRSKASQLAQIGAVSHLVGRTAAEIDVILDAHVRQKAAKLESSGAVARADLTKTRRLLAQAAAPEVEGGPILELHALICGDRIVATFGGLSHAGHWSGLLISHDAEPAFARLSPGELLLAAVIKAKCSEGFSGFDLGIGEARYKDGVCPIVDPLFDSLVPLTARGRLYVAHEALRLRLKGSIKRSRWAWPFLKRWRRRLVARRPRPQTPAASAAAVPGPLRPRGP